MDNIKTLPAFIRKGGVVSLYTTCGLGLLALPSSDELKKMLSALNLTIGNREICLLIGPKTLLTDYINAMPEMALTLMDLSEKELTLQFDDWSHLVSLEQFFPNELSVRLTNNKDEYYIINGVGQPLIFVPITQKELLSCKSFKSDTISFVTAYQEEQYKEFVKPGIIKFFTNGSMKIIRE